MTIRDSETSTGESVDDQIRVDADAVDPPEWNPAEWYGTMLVDIDGKNIGKLQDVYVDVDTDLPQFGTVKEGLFDRHLTFVPLVGIHVGPDYLQVETTTAQVRSAPDLQMHGEELTGDAESALYHHSSSTTPRRRPRSGDAWSGGDPGYRQSVSRRVGRR